MNSLPHWPNLPREQRFVQRLVDQFNRDEVAWRESQDRLLIMKRLRRRLRRWLRQRKAKRRRIALNA